MSAIFIFFYSYLTLLVICFISGIIVTWRLKWTLSPVKLLPWFVLLIFVSEMTARHWANKYHTNHCVYNVYQVCHVTFYSLVLFQMIKNERIRKLLLFVSIGYLIIAITNLCFIQGIHQFNSINFYTGAIILSFFSGYSLNELFRKTAIESPFKMPDFWIGGSILVLNSCQIPLELPVALSLPFTPREVQILLGLIMAVNFIAYSMFIISFWRQYKNRVAAIL